MPLEAQPAGLRPVREGGGAALRAVGPVRRRGSVLDLQRAQPRALPLPPGQRATRRHGARWTSAPSATASCGYRAGRRSPPTTRRCEGRSCSERPRPSPRRSTISTPRCASTIAGVPSGVTCAAGRDARDSRCPFPIGGFAVHPYAQSAAGSVFTRTHTDDSLTMGYLPRLHRLIRAAEEYGRIPDGRGIYVTEFGFQTRPPDPRRGLRPNAQARALNEAERLFAKDPRVRSFSQFELFDVPEGKRSDVFNTGLHYNDGAHQALVAGLPDAVDGQPPVSSERWRSGGRCARPRAPLASRSPRPRRGQAGRGRPAAHQPLGLLQGRAPRARRRTPALPDALAGALGRADGQPRGHRGPDHPIPGVTGSAGAGPVTPAARRKRSQRSRPIRFQPSIAGALSARSRSGSSPIRTASGSLL